MVDDLMRDEYQDYLESHILNVKNAFNWFLYYMPELFREFDSDYLGARISAHDQSKYDDEEFFAYCNYFYGSKKDKEVQHDFDVAWLHHQHLNPHHWQHWLLREDDGNLKALDMPFEYIIEMICDWWAFSWSKNNLYEIFDWYAINKPKMQLSDYTLNEVETLLTKLRNKLNEVTK